MFRHVFLQIQARPIGVHTGRKKAGKHVETILSQLHRVLGEGDGV